MTRVEQLKNEIRIAARVCELRRLAEDTARTYDAAVAASGMTREHFRLRPICSACTRPAIRGGYSSASTSSRISDSVFPLNFQYCGPCIVGQL